MVATNPICNMTAMRPGKYFEQHELSVTGPIFYDYEYTRSLVISAISQSAPGELRDLNLVMESYLETYPDKGTPKPTLWEEKLKEVLAGSPFMGRTPMDFALVAPSRVIILLSGSFWRFSNTMDAITTKHDLGAQYFDLRRHMVNTSGDVVDAGPNDDCQCISFFSCPPCHKDLEVRHGFSLNIELVAAGKALLPITVDPDIENKGGP